LTPDTFEQFALHPALTEHVVAVRALGPNEANAWYDGRPVATTGRSDLERAHAFQIDGSWLGVGSREGGFWQPNMVVHG
jgi:hypothetical protein